MQQNKNGIIINNKSDIDDISCMHVVLSVINQGRISNEGKQYGYSTTFHNHKVIVWTKLSNTIDTFTIIKDDRD